MSERNPSPGDEARHNARLNILQALGSAHTLSPPSPTFTQAAIPTDASTDGLPAIPDAPVSSLPPPPLSPKPRSPRTSPTSRLPLVCDIYTHKKMHYDKCDK